MSISILRIELAAPPFVESGEEPPSSAGRIVGLRWLGKRRSDDRLAKADAAKKKRKKRLHDIDIAVAIELLSEDDPS